jgi:protein phosphatase
MSELSPLGALAISVGEVCDRGKVREENQDNVRNASIPLGELFIVADGIGGYQGGATASRMVVDGFHSQLALRPAGYPVDRALSEACAYTNTSIHDAAGAGDPSLQRMGSTVVLALIEAGVPSAGNSGAAGSTAPVAWIGHVGDSRAYLIRNGEMRKLTSDHSAVQALISRNLITEEEARNHPDASVLTRSLGHRPEVEIEMDRVALQAGDALLLCSDGLWGYVSDGDIEAVATDANLSVQTIADTLLHQALAAGGLDNIGIEFVRIGVASSAARIASSRGDNSAIQSEAAASPLSIGSRQGQGEGASEDVSGNRRTQQMLAVVLLVLAGCGYFGVAAYSGFWPFSHVTPKDGSDVRIAAGPSGGMGDASGNKSGHGSPQHSPKSDHGSVSSEPAKHTGPKLIGIVGDIHLGSFVPPEDGEIDWRHATIKRETRPSCASLAKNVTVVYGSKLDLKGHLILDAILARYPGAKGSIGSSEVQRKELTPDISTACGEEYDAVVILGVKKGAVNGGTSPTTGPASVAGPAPTDAPTNPSTTDSQEHSQPVQQHPKNPQSEPTLPH